MKSTKILALALVLVVVGVGCIDDSAQEGGDLDNRQGALDSDGDGLTDEEERRLGTDPNRVDSDGDGVTDGAEVEAGSNPLDADDRPQQEDPNACQADADCAQGQICDDGACVAVDEPNCTDNDADGFCAEGGDCDDDNALVNPDTPDLRDGLDNDCDGEVDEDERPVECQVDADCARGQICDDGLCEEADPNCTDNDGDGFCVGEGDCDDDDASINPGSEEVEDGLDNDCDGEVDEDEGPVECRVDDDCGRGQICDDGVCEEADPNCTDNDGDGFCVGEGDCDDNNPNVGPGSEEVEDGLDNDCDGEIDESDANVCRVDADCARGQICADGVCVVR